MTFNPEVCVSLDRFHALMNNGPGIPLGKLTHFPQKGFIIFMQEWVNQIDSFLEKVRPDSPLHQLYSNERMFSWAEYKLLFATIEEEKYDLYPIFLSLTIQSKNQLTEFLTHFDDSFEGYLKALHYGIDLRKSVGIQHFMNQLEYRISHDDLESHIYISGSTGSGKSYLMRLLWYQLHRASINNHQHSMILIDPHGSLSHEIKRSHLNLIDPERLIVVDPTIGDGRIPIINPLEIDWKDEKDIVNHAQMLSIAFENIIGGELSVNMKALLVPCLSLLIRRKGSTLLDLLRLMEDDADLIAQGLQLDNDVHRSLFNNFTKKYRPTKYAVAGRIQSFLNFPSFFAMINGHSTINLKEAMNNGKIIIFHLSQNNFGEDGQSDMGRLLVAMIKSFALNRKQGTAKTYLFVDECQMFISPSIKQIMTQARKFGLWAVLANQTIEDLGDLKDTILANTGTKMVGKNNSFESLAALSKTTHANVEQLTSLKPHHFFIKTKNNDGITILPYDTLLHDSSMKMEMEQEQELDAYQREKYYPLKSDKDSKTNSDVDSSENDNDDDNIPDTPSSPTKYPL